MSAHRCHRRAAVRCYACESARTYALVYIWQGERHRHLRTGTLEVMEPIVEEMWHRGFRAWLEVIGESDRAGRPLFSMEDE